jgi:hypothetical protein
MVNTRAKSYEPLAKSYEPSVKSYEPLAKSYEPLVKSYEPLAKSYEPSAKSYEPSAEDTTKYQRLFQAVVEHMRKEQIERMIIRNEQSIDYICAYLPFGISIALLGLAALINILESPNIYQVPSNT